MKELVSVIVPVYNVEKYLKKCLDSIVNQTYKNLEIILVNDGSTDKSGEICEEYAKLDSRISTIHKKNGGQSTARNMGLEMCTGEYVTFVDGDDWIDCNYYEKLVKQSAEGKLDCCVSDRKVFNEEYIEIYDTKFAKKVCYNIENLHEYFLEHFFKYTPVVTNKLYKKECIDDIRFKDIKYYGSEDFLFNFEVMFRIKRVGEIQGTYYNNLARNGSTARKYSPGEVSQYVNLFYECQQVVKTHYIFDDEMQAICLYIFYYFYSRSIGHIRDYCSTFCAQRALKHEISCVYSDLRRIANLLLKNKCMTGILRRYGFRTTGIVGVKLQFLLYMLPYKNISIWFCKKVYRI